MFPLRNSVVRMKFTVITVAYNAGEKLGQTVTNILQQTYHDYELLIKDGMSDDGSPDSIEKDDRIRLVSCKDTSIYDAMNQAVALARGEYVIFMNCGDYFYSPTVLAELAEAIEKEPGRRIYYGDAYFRMADQIFHMPSQITDYVCFSHIPNHQSCIFDRTLWDAEGFRTQYKIRADYEFFLRQVYRNDVKPCYTGVVVADYEGGGYSENKENRKRDKKEHLQIVKQYQGNTRVFWYRLWLFVTLQPLRKWIATDSPFSGLYDSMKRAIFRR